ncbi:MAG TPA: TonB-dependent receptor [Rhizomicrobium sp.]|nr:TonB-dependent receptor [Rhizomicrobium sp.]
MSFRFLVASLVLAGFFTAPAFADDTIETVTVTGDRAHLIETQPDDTALGLELPLLETPRAVTAVSDTTLDRYGITGVDTLTAITPSAYTASYYGVEGAVNLRGTLAESYFEGFKRAEDRGTYTTPLGDAAEIELVRGPPSVIFGPGKVGGLVNFVPKSETATEGDVSGEVTATYGSYSKRNATGQIGVPLDFGSVTGGLHAYGELDDSFSYYHGIHPSHQLIELTGNFATGPWVMQSDYMVYHSNGDVQTPGWNRLTQPLIDNGTYITGSNTSLSTNGKPYLTFNDLGGDPYTFSPTYTPLYIASPGCGACTDAAHMLDSGLGTTYLDRRTVYIDPGVDFSNTITHTGFAELSRALADDDRIRLQGFVDTLANDRFVSYGFPASYRTLIGETRARYDFTEDFGDLTLTNVAGVSYRYVGAIGKESFNSGVIALDRRDISVPALPNDIFASPFVTLPAGQEGLGWENNVHSTTADAGAFATTDIAWDKNLNLILGGRYDAYNVRSVDLGVLPFEPENGQGGKGMFTYSASLNYKTDFGLVPYVTQAKDSAVEIGQASQVLTSLLANDDWLSTSFLDEVGTKFSFLDQHLVGSLAWYRQERTQLQQAGGVITVMGTRSKGGEAEIRYVMNPNLSFTLAGSLQHTIVKGPDQSFAYIPARDAGVSPANGFGGAYVAFAFSELPGKAGNYEDTLIPHAVISPYLTYTSDDQKWGATFGGTYVSQTEQTVPDPIIFPSYVVMNVSSFVRMGEWEADMNIDNLADARTFTPDADTYANLAALPGIGRTWRFTIKRMF